MSQLPLSELAKQIKSANPKERRKAYKQLAASGDPRMIPYLRNAYLNDDDDDVRDIAYDGLARFKAMQQGQTSRRLPVSDDLLKKIAGALAVILVFSLILNGVILFAGGGDDGDAEPTQIAQLTATDRDVLITRMQDRLVEIQTFAAALRSEIAGYNTTGTATCDLTRPVPQALQLAEIDRLTYRDLDILGSKLDNTIANLDIAQFQWRHSCDLPVPDIADVLGASAALDRVDIQVEELKVLLQTAIDDPAPTTAPTATSNPLLPSPTVPSLTMPAATDQPAIGQPTTESIATDQPAAPVEPTFTPLPAASPSLDTSLPYPNDLDYAAILGALNRQLIVLGDLQNQYQTGMADRWQQAQDTPGPSSTSGCTLSPWPAPFALTPEQDAQLHRPGVADAQLDEAIALVHEGMDAALQARALYERDCPTGALADSAAEGIPLAQGAYNRLTTVKELIDTIRQRPTTP